MREEAARKRAIGAKEAAKKRATSAKEAIEVQRKPLGYVGERS